MGSFPLGLFMNFFALNESLCTKHLGKSFMDCFVSTESNWHTWRAYHPLAFMLLEIGRVFFFFFTMQCNHVFSFLCLFVVIDLLASTCLFYRWCMAHCLCMLLKNTGFFFLLLVWLVFLRSLQNTGVSTRQRVGAREWACMQEGQKTENWEGWIHTPISCFRSSSSCPVSHFKIHMNMKNFSRSTTRILISFNSTAVVHCAMATQ